MVNNGGRQKEKDQKEVGKQFGDDEKQRRHKKCVKANSEAASKVAHYFSFRAAFCLGN